MAVRTSKMQRCPKNQISTDRQPNKSFQAVINRYDHKFPFPKSKLKKRLIIPLLVTAVADQMPEAG